MLKIELRGVASSQKFEENRQSVKNDDVVCLRSFRSVT